MQQSHEVRSTGTKIARALIWVFLLFIAVITIFPVLYVVFGSFKENKELLEGGANIFPKTFVDVYNAAVAKDVDKVRELQERIMRVSSLIYGVGHHNSSFVKGVKCALSLMGICSDSLAAPREPFNDRDRELIRRRIVELGAL